MRLSLFAFVFMLILAVVPVSIMSSQVSSQSYVTVTTQVTTTATYTTPVRTQYATSTETGYVYGPKAFRLQGNENYVTCSDLKLKLNASEGQQFHIDWTSTWYLNFYITTQPAMIDCYETWTNPIGFSMGETLYSISGVNGSVDWTAPSAGQFIIWLVNSSPNTSSGTLSVETSLNSTLSTIIFATSTWTYRLQRTSSVPEAQTIASSLTTTIMNNNPAYSSLGLTRESTLAVLVIGILALLTPWVTWVTLKPKRTRRTKIRKNAVLLERLEQLHASGQVSEELYRKLKEEYEANR